MCCMIIFIVFEFVHLHENVLIIYRMKSISFDNILYKFVDILLMDRADLKK